MEKDFKYIELYKKLKEKIEKNELTENSKLPSIRFLAKKYNLNNITVLKAYNLLEKDGYIIKKQGAGIFVKPKEYIFYNSPIKNSTNTFNQGFKKLDSDNIINFISGNQNFNIEIYNKLKEILLKLSNSLEYDVFNYQLTEGNEKLRKIIKDKLLKKDIYISIKNIQIINGTQQGLDLILKSIITKNRNKIIVGEPTYHGALNIFRNNCKIFTVKMEKDGFNLEELENILINEKISFIYTMTDLSCPMGISWSDEKKIKLLELAKKYKTYILEDDFSSELYYNNSKKISLKSLDTENKYVIYLKSYSKILSSGLRLAFMIFPNELSEKIKGAKFISDISSSGLEQYILLEFLKDKFLEQHIKNLNKIYKERYEYIKSEIKKIEELEIEYDIEGGFYIWLKLDSKIDYNKFYSETKKLGILLLPAFYFYLDNKNRPYFRLSFASTDKEKISLGFKGIKEIIENLNTKRKNTQ
ncbi:MULTISPECIES: PLP-dependent aminotransferase family protein [Fusobacterium]|uniref:aminotransferase-like domain-containing protein n=1 Tax=Fusobacterium TaxID=848 RepID=UPI001477865E|nr:MULTISPECIES: PLP-dependent aminotransferase family protein [Fusobacterium]NME35263.1 PLP-dependent aminotransferase family protein [Fusobacterium sp. FSA-380-WT-3A]